MSAVVGIDIGGSSVKVVCLDECRSQQTTTISKPYENPGRDGLLGAIRECLCALDVSDLVSVGLCMPGKMKPDRSAVHTSVNLPVLNDWRVSDLIGSVFEQKPIRFRVVSDADAAGYDYADSFPIAGRTAAISIGTGVGLCVLDGSNIAQIGEKGIGHLGLMDVGRHGSEDRYDSHGVRNTLESYIGSTALSAFQSGGKLDLNDLHEDDPAFMALIHALRVVHAIYQPDRIALLGGVGMAFERHHERIRRMVAEGLTTLAAEEWTVEFGRSNYHAAMGAARLAAQEL